MQWNCLTEEVVEAYTDIISKLSKNRLCHYNLVLTDSTDNEFLITISFFAITSFVPRSMLS